MIKVYTLKTYSTDFDPKNLIIFEMHKTKTIDTQLFLKYKHLAVWQNSFFGNKFEGKCALACHL